jgi:hypothetical protein
MSAYAKVKVGHGVLSNEVSIAASAMARSSCDQIQALVGVNELT